MIKIIFFDLDGVLTKEKKGSAGTCASLCKTFPELDFDTVVSCYKTHFGHLLTQDGSFSNHLQAFGKCIGASISEDEMYNALTDITTNTEMLALAAELKKQYQVGIITNNSSERLRLLEAKMHLPELFDPIITSGDVHAAKADGTVAIFDIALQAAACKAHEAVFIDNTKINLDTPSKMGINTYLHDDETNDVSALRLFLTSI